MKRTMIFLLLLGSLAASQTARAVTCTSNASTAWNLTTTWSGCAGGNGAPANTPGPADDAIIGPHTVTVTANAAARSLTVNGTLNVGGFNLTIGTTTIVAGTIAFVTSNAGTKVFTGPVTIAGGTWTNNTINEGINFRGGLTFNGGTFTPGTGVYLFNTAAQAIGGTSAISIPNVNVTGVTLTNNGTLTVSTALSGSGGLSNAATLNIGGTSTVTTLTANTLGNTVNYSGAAQTVRAVTYHDLALSGSLAKTMPGAALTINGNFTMSGSATATSLQAMTVAGNFSIGATNSFTAGAFNHSVAGDFTLSAGGILTSGSSTFTFNGASGVTPQTLTGAATFTNMTVNNSGIGLKLANDVTVTTAAAGGLILTDGNIDTQSFNLIVTRNCNVSATVPVNRSAGTAGWIIGNLRKTYPTGTPVTCSFEVGDTLNYTPVTSASFTSITAAGTLQARTDAGEHADTTANTSGIDASNSVNRTWTLALPGGSTLAFAAGTYSATFNFINPGDLDGIPTPAGFVVARKVSGEWTYPSTSSATGTTTTATGIPDVGGFGEFAIGVPKLLAAFGEWRMDDTTWVDSSGNGFNGTGAGLSGGVPTGANASPAVASSPGTCAYGVFNRANKTYIGLPGSFPNLGQSNGFTITAWIRTTDNTQSGQRILIDDEGITGGGYGFSLGDNGTGMVRFFSRGTASALILDTPNVIANNIWYFVAAVADIKNRRKTIYVYDSAGTLLASPTIMWTEASFGSDAGIASIGGETNSPPNIGEGTSSFGFAGNLDEVRVFQSAWSREHVNLVRQLTRNCALVDHYQISHSGTGINCQPENVTIAAHDAGHVAVVPASTITVTARRVAGAAGNRGDWSLVAGTGILNNLTADDGVATYAFGIGESSVVLGLKDTYVQTVNIDVLDGAGITESSGTGGSHADANLNFLQSGFKFTSPIGTQIAATASVSYDLQAIRTDLKTGACSGAFTGLVPNIELASECVDPSTCQAGQQVNFVNNGSGVIAANPAGAPSSYTTRTLNFGASSTAQFTFDYPDVGAIRLHARYNIPLGGGGGSGNLMTGATDVGGFVVKPATFKLMGIKRTPDNFANPGAGDATGSVFIKAGEDITLTLRSENSLGNLTQNFGKESAPEGVALTATLVAPSPGNNPALANATIAGASFSGGQATVTNVRWGEVGIITLTPAVADGNYLGAGSVAGTTTTNVGRFTPFDFALAYNLPQFTTACAAGAFTYAGQLFSYGTAPVLTATARNKAGVTTLNYKGTAPSASAFFKLTNASLTPVAQAQRYSAATATLDVSALPLASADPGIVANGDGTGTLTFSSGGSGIAFNRNAPVAPFDADIALAINVIDADLIAFAGNPASFGAATAGNGIGFSAGKTMRFGRLRLQNSLGSEKLTLPVPIETQYWNGSAFMRNAQDSCTTLAKSNLALSGYAVNLAACETTANQASVSFAAGLGTLTLSPAGAGNNGSLLLTANLGTSASGNFCPASPGAEALATAANKAYLQGAWTGATWNENPSARATFGLFGSQPQNFIFFRENY